MIVIREIGTFGKSTTVYENGVPAEVLLIHGKKGTLIRIFRNGGTTVVTKKRTKPLDIRALCSLRTSGTVSASVRAQGTASILQFKKPSPCA